MQKLVSYRIDSRLRCGAALLALSVAAAGPALAQDSAADAEDGVIIVTGTRIMRPEISFPNPVISAGIDKIEQSGTTNVTDFLKDVPALVGSSDSGENSGSGAGIGFTGLNLLDLRNLGIERTLVLVDGRRHVAAVDGLQAVDINTIPTDLIERVDVLTGGASAIYGADGVTGVVNFVQKKNFEGITARVQGGYSGHGDAGQRLVAITAGHNFADGRGNIAVAYEYGREERLQTRQRAWLSGTRSVGFFLNPDDTETGAQNNDGIPDRIPLADIRYFDTSREGGIDVDFDGMPDYYGANGAVFDPGRYIPAFYQQGGSATLVSDYGNDLLPDIKRNVVNALFHYEFSPAVEVYAEAKYAKTKSFSLGQPTFDYYLHVSPDNPFIPASVRAVMDPVDGVLVTRDNFDLGQRGEEISRETIRTVIGARGEISPNLRYDASYVYGRAKIVNHYIGDILDDRFYAAIDVVDGPNGPTCRVNVEPGWTPNQPDNYTREEYAPTTFAPGSCIPFNLFGEGVNSQAALDWLRTDTTDRSRISQHVLSGAINGDTKGLLELPGGPIGFALGAEYRKEASSFVPDALAAQGLTFTNALGSTVGSFDVKEAFGELHLPLLKDAPFAYRLELGGAVRFSDYSTVGKTTAWKLDGVWSPVRDVTFRGTYSTAVRAPNISELFDAPSQSFEFIDDPCDINYLQNGTQYRADNCTALLSSLGVADPSSFEDTRSVNILGLQGGNPALSEETAKTWTAGVVLQPRFAPGLTITADWYDIRISNAINTVTPQKVAELCVDQTTLDNQYCAAITRTNGGSDAGFISSFVVGPLNVANFQTAGLDATLSYQYRTATAGTFQINLQGNYLRKLATVPIPGAASVNEAYVGGANGTSPEFQLSGDLTWKKDKLLLNWGVSWFSKTYRYSRQTTASNPDIVAPQYLKFKERFVHDVYASYELTDTVQISGGINNLFNQKPSLGSSYYPVNAVGRYFYLGAKVKLPDIF